MAWSFRKKIKIAPGVHVNLSKSGISTSIGPRGAKVTVGPKGTYMHTGIPGTGLYNRQKIDSESEPDRQSATSSLTQAIVSNLLDTISSNKPKSWSSYDDSFRACMDMDRTGKITFSFTDYLGRPITDEAIVQKLIRKVKAHYQYKEKLDQLYRTTYEEVNADTEAFTNLYTKTPKLKTESEVKVAFANITLKHYAPLMFEEDGPDKEKIRQQLSSEAEEKINYFFRWKNKPAREQYVEENTPIVYEQELREWERKKNEFNAHQADIKKLKDAEYLHEYLEQKQSLNVYFSRDKYEILGALQSESERINKEVPGDFGIHYHLDIDYDVLYVELDLPEVEEIPKDKAVYLPSGNVSFKQKTMKEIQLDYVKCICGLSFFVAGRLFNVNSSIKFIQVSGYTQRINKATGEENNDYVYSVFFDKEAFSILNVEAIDPLTAMREFPCRVKASVTGVLTTITPFAIPGKNDGNRGKFPKRDLK